MLQETKAKMELVVLETDDESREMGEGARERNRAFV